MEIDNICHTHFQKKGKGRCRRRRISRVAGSGWHLASRWWCCCCCCSRAEAQRDECIRYSSSKKRQFRQSWTASTHLSKPSTQSHQHSLLFFPFPLLHPPFLLFVTNFYGLKDRYKYNKDRNENFELKPRAKWVELKWERRLETSGDAKVM